MPELLLELFSEEIPARMQARAADDLRRLVTDTLKDAGLTFTRADAYATPRRLALVIDGLPERTPDLREEKKGPRVGSPEQAIQGFLKGAGLASLDQCEKRVVGKAEFWFAVVEKKGVPTEVVVTDAIGDALVAFPWPKSMRFGSEQLKWVRPLQGMVLLFNGQLVRFSQYRKAVGGIYSSVLNGELDASFSPLSATHTTRGHRFLAPEPFSVSDFADYRKKLRDHFVILDPAERRALIARETARIAKELGVTVRDDPGLLDEVTGLVEWPVVIAGTIDAAFMDVPQEVLVTSMRTHQKYFACLKPDGSLAPHFLVVANMETDAGGRANIVAGNERVLRARLSDAKFFWDQDRKQRLESRVPALEQRIFYQGLGTMADKVGRIETLAVKIAEMLGQGDPQLVARAAKLAKADLSTGMVGEFPELQGVMGAYYARHDGERPEVQAAIREHYSPLGPNDRVPHQPVSVAVALADKIDSLVGFFVIGEKPTGSKDPFALRRAALGVIRLIVENKLRLRLLPTFEAAAAKLPASTGGKAISADLLDFFADRLKVALREQGVRHDLIDAVFALGGEDDIVRLLARVDALKQFLATDDGANLLVAFRRAANIVAIEEKKDKAKHDGPIDAAALTAPEEKRLHEALGGAAGTVRAAIEVEDFTGAMRALAALRAPVDAFFDKVTVNAPEPPLRANRLRLLNKLGATMRGVAEFTRIEG